MSFAKPWERKATDRELNSQIAEQSRSPWDPVTPRVPERIAIEHDLKRTKTQEPRPEKKLQYQAFAKAYLIDFDHQMAAIRIGVEPEKAAQVGRVMINDPFTLQAVQAYMGRLEQDKILTRERVLMGLLEEANYRGIGASHSARVASWSKLAKLLGMELPPEDEAKAVKGGVMLVPFIGGIEAWEKAATGQQAQLKADVRT